MVTRVKICCISSEDEASAAVRAGASALGLVSEMPSGPGVVEESVIAAVALSAPPGVATFLLTSKTDVASIIEQQRRCKVNTLQLVDSVSADDCAALRSELPGVKIVKVIHVEDESSVREAASYVGSVDSLLLDSGNTKAAVRELGGTGRIHDWKFSAEIVKKLALPVFLAGGLNPENAAEAIAQVKPFGLDICSGVRSGGSLDENKLRSFMSAVQGAS